MIRRECLQMMEHAATGRHAARRDHHLGIAAGGDRLGTFDVSRVSRDSADRAADFRREAVISTVRMKQVGRVDRHGAVKIDRNVQQPAGGLEFPQMIEQRLCAADGEGWDNDGAAAVDCALDHRAENLGGVARFVNAIAVGGFDDNEVGFRNWLGIGHHRIVVASEIAGEGNAAAGPFDVGGCGAQDVPGMTEC